MNIDRLEHIYLEYDLSQKQYPMSFRYYDFIINFINENFPSDRRDYFKTNMKIASEFHVQNERSNLLFKLGIYKQKDE